jgi:hypothetical protein
MQQSKNIHLNKRILIALEMFTPAMQSQGTKGKNLRAKSWIV